MTLAGTGGLARSFELLWRAVDACQRVHGLEDTRHYLVGSVLACHLWRQSPVQLRVSLTDLGNALASRLVADAAALEERNPDLMGVMVALVGALPEDSASTVRLARAVLLVLDQGGEPASLVDDVRGYLCPTASPRATTTTPEGLVSLLVQVAGPRPGEHILDPAAGEGSLLLAIARRTRGQVTLSGREADEWAWRIARVRFFLRGLAVDLGVGPSDSLGDWSLRALADLVVLDPPLAQRQLLNWLRSVLEMLGPDGRAVVALPEAILSPGTGRRPAAVDVSRVETVVIGPDRLRPDMGVGMVVVVLRRDPSDRPVLFVDASKLAKRQDTLKTFHPGVIEELGRVLRLWQDGSTLPSSRLLALAEVSRDQVLALGDVCPGTWLRDAHDSPEVIQASQRALHLAKELRLIVEGPLEHKTTDEHKRALRRLVDRLEGTGTAP